MNIICRLLTSIFTTALLLTCLYPLSAYSQNNSATEAVVTCLDKPRERVIDIRRIYNCANETETYQAFDKEISQALEQPTQRERFAVLATGSNTLLSWVAALEGNLQTPPASRFIQSLSSDLTKLEQYFSDPQGVEFSRVERILVTNRWAFSNKDPDGHLFTAFEATRAICADDITADGCLSAINEAGEVAALARFANRINSVFHDEGYDLAITQESNIISTLQSVEANAPFQYPWELLVNRRWLDCSLSGKRNSEFTGASGILTTVPDCHFILLHPDAAFGYAPESTEGAKSTEALVIELAGFMTYKFQQNEVKHAWGMSVATTLADLEGGNNDIGLGLTFRYDKFGLTVSKHRGELLYLLNLELFDVVAEKATDFAKYIQ